MRGGGAGAGELTQGTGAGLHEASLVPQHRPVRPDEPAAARCQGGRAPGELRRLPAGAGRPPRWASSPTSGCWAWRVRGEIHGRHYDEVILVAGLGSGTWLAYFLRLDPVHRPRLRLGHRLTLFPLGAPPRRRYRHDQPRGPPPTLHSRGGQRPARLRLLLARDRVPPRYHVPGRAAALGKP